MRRSIAAKLFAATLCVFVVALIIQWLFMSRYFDDVYINSVLSGYREEFLRYTASFTSGDENSRNADLRRYTAETGAPVLAIDSSHRLADRVFMSYFPVLTVRRTGGETIRVPVGYLEELKNPPSLRNGMTFKLRAVQIGNTSYWEPLIITTTTSHTNRTSMRRYRIEESDARELDEYVTVTHVQYVLEGTDLQRLMAEMMLEAMKDCLVNRLDVESTLAALGGQEISGPYGNTYRLLYEPVGEGDRRYFLVTMRSVFVSGREQVYLNRFFYIVYGVLGLFLVITAYGLSRFVSRPLEALNTVTRRLAGLDFSVQAAVRGEDELAQLSQSINTMSDSLESALSELKESNRELRQASLQSRRNEERMKTLLADLAHEFKTPLGIISSYAEIFEKNLQGVNAQHYYRVIDSEIDHLTEMVDEVIELSHMQAGIWSVSMELCDLSEIITPTLAGFGKRLEQSGFTAVAHLEELTVMADPRRIAQVLRNLLSNAIKYSNGTQITVTAAREGACARVSVGNPGNLTEEDRQLIWERYYLKSGETLTRLPSEGIGLDIVRRILTEHNSRYDVDCRGGMVWFSFTLALHEEDPNQES